MPIKLTTRRWMALAAIAAILLALGRWSIELNRTRQRVALLRQQIAIHAEAEKQSLEVLRLVEQAIAELEHESDQLSQGQKERRTVDLAALRQAASAQAESARERVRYHGDQRAKFQAAAANPSRRSPLDGPPIRSSSGLGKMYSK